MTCRRIFHVRLLAASDKSHEDKRFTSNNDNPARLCPFARARRRRQIFANNKTAGCRLQQFVVIIRESQHCEASILSKIHVWSGPSILKSSSIFSASFGSFHPNRYRSVFYSMTGNQPPWTFHIRVLTVCCKHYKSDVRCGKWLYLLFVFTITGPLCLSGRWDESNEQCDINAVATQV